MTSVASKKSIVCIGNRFSGDRNCATAIRVRNLPQTSKWSAIFRETHVLWSRRIFDAIVATRMMFRLFVADDGAFSNDVCVGSSSETNLKGCRFIQRAKLRKRTHHHLRSRLTADWRVWSHRCSFGVNVMLVFLYWCSNMYRITYEIKNYYCVLECKRWVVVRCRVLRLAVSTLNENEYSASVFRLPQTNLDLNCIVNKIDNRDLCVA